MLYRLSRTLGVFAAAVAALLMLGVLAPAMAEEASPFEKLAGRWVGEGRFGVRDGNTEMVKCRVTYILAAQGQEVKQTIRCASAGGNVEIQSSVAHKAGTISGTWKELVRDWSGDISGSVTPKGFRVAVRGENLNANMDVILHNGKQILEVQFIESSLIGLTLILEHADSPTR
jgi:hypothetical protein